MVSRIPSSLGYCEELLLSLYYLFFLENSLYDLVQATNFSNKLVYNQGEELPVVKAELEKRRPSLLLQMIRMTVLRRLRFGVRSMRLRRRFLWQLWEKWKTHCKDNFGC